MRGRSRALLLVAALGGSATCTGNVEGKAAAALRAQGLVGMTWSIVDPEGRIVPGAAGVRDARDGRPMSPSDRVHVGSIAKTLLSAGILNLVTQGRLDLEAPLATLLPAIRLDNPWAATDPVRLRHLLDHTAGLDDARLWQVFSLQADPDAPLASAFARPGSLLRIRSRPGSRASYSNMGYTLAAMVLEAATGERYERYLDANLLKSLGMDDSTFAFVTQAGPRGDARLALGHFEGGAAQAAVPIALRPATQFTTTAADMARLARFLMGDGRTGGAVFIRAELLRSMGQPTGTEAALAGLQAGYALGLAQHDRHGVVGRCHGGSTVGYQAMLCTFPEQGRAYFWAANADVEDADYGQLDRAMIAAAGVAPSRVASAAGPMPGDLSRWEGVYLPSPNRFEQFAWVDAVFGFVRVGREGDALRLAPFQGKAVTVEPLGGALFRAPGRAQASHAFMATGGGGAAFSRGTQTYERRAWPVLAALWASLALGVAGALIVMVQGFTGWPGGGVRRRPGDWISAAAIAALALPVPFYFAQSFLALGDLTLASGLLAIVTAFVPMAMLFGLVRALRPRPRGLAGWLRALSLGAVLQFTLVLAAWGLWPMLTWR